jgi:hypothetical protein
MIEIALLPDGARKLPAEARDQSVLASHLKAANADVEGNNSVVIDWRAVERVVTTERLYLRVPGTMDEYNSTALNAMTGAIVNNITGLKAHPDGWQETSSEN